MKSMDVVTATVEVAVDPASAFAIFTEEIGRWWRPGPINWNDSQRAVGVRIEPGVGGRWIEVYDGTTGEGFECGRITVWEPGVRFVCLYRDAGHSIDETEVEVRFEAIAGGTKVTLEHRGWDRLLTDIAASTRRLKRWGWANILGWFKEWAFWGSPRRVERGGSPSRGPNGYVLAPGAGVAGAGPEVKASRTSTGGSLMLIESHTMAGAPLHIHSREDECFYVVEGALTVRCGEEIFEAGPRSFVFLPRGIPHAWDVIGKGAATVLVITVPGGFEDFLREFHAAGGARGEARDQIAAKYGITWIG
jgi:mannose-6-phosphate isomerase-like protein (cupin superfamily)